MMHKKLPLIKNTSAFLLFFTALLFSTSTVNAQQFGQRVEGAWLGAFEALGLPPARVLATLSRDGTITTSDATDFLGQIQSPTHGSWRRTGNRQIAFTLLALNYDPQGNFTGITQTRGTGKLDNNDELIGSFVSEFFVAEQDPLDPEAIPVSSIAASFTARRILAD